MAIDDLSERYVNFYTHFGEANSILMSNLKTHGSWLICVPLFTFVKKQEKWILE